MLDSDYLHRAAPPGSMRYFALLYSPPAQRELLTALFVVESEIRASTDAAHEVAHTRLQWWRGEIDRLINRNAQHPATKVLQSALPEVDFSKLHEVLVAADMDLARMTYHTTQELNAYLERSGGGLFELAEDTVSRPSSRRLGGLIRRVETLRDLAVDLRAGRLYWPIDELSASGISPQRPSDPEYREPWQALLASEAQRLCATLSTLEPPGADGLARPMAVLAALHGRLAKTIADAPESVFSTRHELGALQKVWTAWRAARRS